MSRRTEMAYTRPSLRASQHNMTKPWVQAALLSSVEKSAGLTMPLPSSSGGSRSLPEDPGSTRHPFASGYPRRSEPQGSQNSGHANRHDQPMAQGSGVTVCQRSVGEDSLPDYGPVGSGNRLVRTRMPGGVGAGGEKSPATRLDIILTSAYIHYIDQICHCFERQCL